MTPFLLAVLWSAVVLICCGLVLSALSDHAWEHGWPTWQFFVALILAAVPTILVYLAGLALIVAVFG